MGIGASSLGGAADGAGQDIGRATLGVRNTDSEGANAFQVGVRDAQQAPSTETGLATIPEEPGDTAEAAAIPASGTTTENRVSASEQEIAPAYRQRGVALPRDAGTGQARTSPAQTTGVAGGSEVSNTRGLNPIQGAIADFRRVANSRHYQQTDAERENHPSIALHQGRLSRAVDNMEAATDGHGTILSGQRDEYDGAFREAADSSTQLIATQRAISEETRGVRNTADTAQIARGTRNGIIYSGLASAGVAGITGGLIAWNNVREATHPASTSGGTNETNNGTNTINNNSTTNGTTNSTSNTTNNTTGTTNANTSTQTNGTSNSTTNAGNP